MYAAARLVGPGEMCTYGDLARAVDSPGGAQAVGRAMGSNPFPIVVPCHRVLSSTGALHGFSAPGGIVTKRRMLEIERAPGFTQQIPVRLIIEFHREPLGRYHSTFTRADGAVLKLQGGSYNKLGGGVRVPHDIAHLIVEQTLGLRGGLWGTIAVGGLVMNLEFIGGKKPAHAGEEAVGDHGRRGRDAAPGRGASCAPSRTRWPDGHGALARTWATAGRCRSRASSWT